MDTRNEGTGTQNDGIKRIGANVSRDLHTKAKIAAAMRQIGLTEWLIEAIEEKLSREKRKSLEVVR